MRSYFKEPRLIAFSPASWPTSWLSPRSSSAWGSASSHGLLHGGAHTVREGIRDRPAALLWPGHRGHPEPIRPIADRLRELGGGIVTNKAAVRVLTEGERAVGVQFADGSRQLAELVFVSGGARSAFSA